MESFTVNLLRTEALNCPEDDSILTDLLDKEISDETTIADVEWRELKQKYFLLPNFDRKSFYN